MKDHGKFQRLLLRFDVGHSKETVGIDQQREGCVGRLSSGQSFRFGATTRAQLADTPVAVMEWVNRWGTETDILVMWPMRII
jgi:hypothetical protein